MNDLILVYKQQNNSLPFLFEHMYKQNNLIRERNTRQDSNIHVNYYRTRIGEKTLQVSGAKLRNKYLK